MIESKLIEHFKTQPYIYIVHNGLISSVHFGYIMLIKGVDVEIVEILFTRPGCQCKYFISLVAGQLIVPVSKEDAQHLDLLEIWVTRCSRVSH